MVEQKTLHLTKNNGDLYNFLRTGLNQMLKDGWRVKESAVDRDETRGFFLLERQHAKALVVETRAEPSRLEIAASFGKGLVSDHRNHEWLDKLSDLKKMRQSEFVAETALDYADALIKAAKEGAK